MTTKQLHKTEDKNCLSVLILSHHDTTEHCLLCFGAVCPLLFMFKQHKSHSQHKFHSNYSFSVEMGFKRKCNKFSYMNIHVISYLK